MDYWIDPKCGCKRPGNVSKDIPCPKHNQQTIKLSRHDIAVAYNVACLERYNLLKQSIRNPK